MPVRNILVAGPFDDLRSGDVRFLLEASRMGRVAVALRTDGAVGAATGKRPRFSYRERRYLLSALRYVERIFPLDERAVEESRASILSLAPDLWAADGRDEGTGHRSLAESLGIPYRILGPEALQGFPPQAPARPKGTSSRCRVIVTGCFDWLHSGHIRFFEEAAGFGELHVGVGSDRNIRILKGPGHPHFPGKERLFMVQAVRNVRRAFLTTGEGWMDAGPEIARLTPHVYVTNEDGDQPEKREFCTRKGIEYVVLKRRPKPGLPRRDSTSLRGY